MTLTGNADLPPWLSEEDCNVHELRTLAATRTALSDYPHAVEVRDNVLTYDSAQLRQAMSAGGGGGGGTKPALRMLQAELARAIAHGPGVVVLTGAFDGEVVDRATAAFNDLIHEQRVSGDEPGDHFATPGANDRVWNALEKLATVAPDVFVDYYANDMLALLSTAWLGPAYQVTSQVNVVNPGGAGQTVHSDYHLGFLDNETAAAYPTHVHQLSQGLTLQGAVAHCDMPVETGPTLYLPHSQKLLTGYLAWRRPEFQELFASEHVQLPLAKGDAVFFNPALFHAAGSNHTSDVRRMANLLQVSSAFGRAMESVDRARATAAVFPALQRRRAEAVDEAALRYAVAAVAEGYPFPTNLDRDAPVGGLRPQSQAELAWEALENDWTTVQLVDALQAHAERRQTG